ncbi:MAG: hypothetical protein R3C59_18530 [Planctomycetaceae bacterium]
MTDERLIQRCVDNELTSAERTELLRQLEQSPDDWRLLACTYIEEQLFAAAVQESDQHEAARMVRRVATNPNTAMHWFHHPVTSVVLSLSVAFLLGVLITRQTEFAAESQFAAIDQNPAQSAASMATSRPGRTSPSAVLASERPVSAQSRANDQPQDVEYSEVLRMLQLMNRQWQQPPGRTRELMESISRQQREVDVFLQQLFDEHLRLHAEEPTSPSSIE